MTSSRRRFLQGAGASLIAGALGCSSRSRQPTRGVPSGSGVPVGSAASAATTPRDRAPHYLVLVTLRGGFDNVMSVSPKEQDKVGDKIHCGYRPDERVRGSLRLFGPLIGGLERHDADLCLIHGVRSDTVAHPDGLAMLTRGSRSSRPGEIAVTLAQQLAGNAPLPNLDLTSLDGQLVLRDRERPRWADLRAKAHLAQIESLGAAPEPAAALGRTSATSATLERFLDETRHDARALDAKFSGPMASHFRLAYQAIRGNWAKCIHVASRLLAFDSHSDNDRFQRTLVPPTLADLAAFVDLLKATRNEHGTLFEQTTIVAFSELGRFPRLNDQQGKDHFPENSWIVLGNRIKKGLTVGGIDDSGKGYAVDFRTGAPTRDHARPIYLENGFATLVEITGGDPVKAGYAKDSVLRCVVA